MEARDQEGLGLNPERSSRPTEPSAVSGSSRDETRKMIRFLIVAVLITSIAKAATVIMILLLPILLLLLLLLLLLFLCYVSKSGEP